MSLWVAGTMAVAYGIDKIAGGFTGMSQKKKAEEAKIAAGEIYEQELNLLGEKSNIALTGTEIQIGSKIGDVKTQERTAISQSGLARSGTITEKATSDVKKLFDTRALAQAETSLQYDLGAISAEDKYQSTITGIESTPGAGADTSFGAFMEGAFG